jgi:hypothetical protein
MDGWMDGWTVDWGKRKGREKNVAGCDDGQKTGQKVKWAEVGGGVDIIVKCVWDD